MRAFAPRVRDLVRPGLRLLAPLLLASAAAAALYLMAAADGLAALSGPLQRQRALLQATAPEEAATAVALSDCAGRMRALARSTLLPLPATPAAAVERLARLCETVVEPAPPSDAAATARRGATLHEAAALVDALETDLQRRIRLYLHLLGVTTLLAVGSAAAVVGPGNRPQPSRAEGPTGPDRRGDLPNLIQALPDAVVVTDERGTIELFNPAAERLFGYRAGEVRGHNAALLLPEPHRSLHRRHMQRMLRVLARRRSDPIEIAARRKDRMPLELEATLGVLRCGGRSRVVSVVRDIATRKRREQALNERLFGSLLRENRNRHREAEALSRRASTDHLTGIHNRQVFEERTAHLLGEAARYGTVFSLMLLDIDHFKRINDTYGHAVGDDVLRETAAVIGSELRDTDTFARWGGEEFAVLLPATDLDGACLLAERIRQALAGHRFTSAGRITASLGVTGNRRDDSAASLFRRADTVLYEAKRNGRDQVRKRR